MAIPFGSLFGKAEAFGSVWHPSGSVKSQVSEQASPIWLANQPGDVQTSRDDGHRASMSNTFHHFRLPPTRHRDPYIKSQSAPKKKVGDQCHVFFIVGNTSSSLQILLAFTFERHPLHRVQSYLIFKLGWQKSMTSTIFAPSPSSWNNFELNQTSNISWSL